MGVSLIVATGNGVAGKGVAVGNGVAVSMTSGSTNEKEGRPVGEDGSEAGTERTAGGGSVLVAGGTAVTRLMAALAMGSGWQAVVISGNKLNKARSDSNGKRQGSKRRGGNCVFINDWADRLTGCSKSSSFGCDVGGI